MSQWKRICTLDEIPTLGARVLPHPAGDICVFRNADDEVFALHDRCPHKGGPLSQGIVHGTSVTCPLHAWVISLETGSVEGPDEGCVHRIAVELQAGRIRLGLPSPQLVANG